jgi:hypothetical protein
LTVISTCVNKLLVAKLLNSIGLISVRIVSIHTSLCWQIVKWTLLELTSSVVLLHIHHLIICMMLLLIHRVVIIIIIYVVIVLVVNVSILIVVKLSNCT